MKRSSLAFIAASVALVSFLHVRIDPHQGRTYLIDWSQEALAQSQFTVTLGDTIQWNPIEGAHFDVGVKNVSGGAFLDPPGELDVGAANEVAVSALLSGRPGGTYYIRVQSNNPDGTLPSGYSPEVEFTLTGFPIPTGISKKP